MFRRQTTFGRCKPLATRAAIGFLQGRGRRLSIAAVLVSTLALALASGPAPGADPHTLEIVSKGGVHVFSVELAVTDEERARGLMFRHELPDGKGMLFDFGRDQEVAMWMKNTLIPLDMLFVDAAGRIINIHERAVPGSLATISAAAPARAVIELNGGTAARLGIRPGDRVMFPIFGNAAK